MNNHTAEITRKLFDVSDNLFIIEGLPIKSSLVPFFKFFRATKKRFLFVLLSNFSQSKLVFHKYGKD